jgi:cytochrome P450 family 135
MASLPPVPAEPPVLQTARWLLRPIAFMESCRRRFGDAFGVHLVGFRTPLYMVSDPAVIRALYTERRHTLPPGRTAALLPMVGSRSLLLLEGADHLARRRLMLPPFHGERMRAYAGIMREAAEAEIERWPADGAFALHPSMQAITLDVILRAVFGVTDDARRAELAERLRRLLDATSSPALQWGVLLARRIGRLDPLARLMHVRREIDTLLYEEIAERRADPDRAGRDDILSMFAGARFEDGSAMSDRELRDQLMTLLLAGHETTATALAWTFDLLVRHPPVLARLTRAVDAGEQEYLRAVVAESLRLRPVVALAGRRLATELRIGRFTLPPGSDVTPAIWLAHTRPDTYPEPYAFRPERFLGRAPETYSWVPFGGGVRRCLGAAFAEFEMRVVLETVLRRRALRRASPHAEHVARRNVTFSPRHGTRVHAAARDGRARAYATARAPGSTAASARRSTATTRPG